MRDTIDGINEKAWDRAMQGDDERQTTTRRYQEAVRAAQAADDRLSALLHVKYGKRAGDMRYRPAETVEIGLAMMAYLEASDARQTAWLATSRRGTK